MHSAFNDNHADTKATRIARLAARAVLACALAAGAGFASAQQYGERPYGDRAYGERRDDQGMQQAMQQQRERFTLPQQDRDQRQAEMRAYEEQRRAQQQQQQQQDAGRRGSGRLTPDERRDLRRQINEAGMDLYPQRRR